MKFGNFFKKSFRNPFPPDFESCWGNTHNYLKLTPTRNLFSTYLTVHCITSIPIFSFKVSSNKNIHRPNNFFLIFFKCFIHYFRGMMLIAGLGRVTPCSILFSTPSPLTIAFNPRDWELGRWGERVV